MNGVWTALVTPFDSNYKIDFAGLKNLLLNQIRAGISGVIPCGSTGEGTSLTLEEKKQIILFTLQTLHGSGVKTIPGIGTGSMAESLEFCHWISTQPVDGLMIVTPPYIKPSQQGLLNYFETLANAVECEIILYHVPSRTGSWLDIETITQLASHPRIRSLKEASGQVSFSSQILHALSIKNLSLDILSGDDVTFLPCLSIGGTGVVSVASNLFPKAMVSIQNAFKNGKMEEATKIHQYYYPLFRDLFIESNPGPIKYALEYIRVCQSHLRPPLASLSSKNIEKLKYSLQNCKISSGELF